MDLEVPSLDDVDHRRLVLLVRIVEPGLLRDKRPELVDVDCRTVLAVLDEMEVANADLPEVPWVVLVEVDAVLVLAAGVPAAAGMLPVLADAALAGRNLPAHVPILLQPRRHRSCCSPRRSPSSCRAAGLPHPCSP